MAALEDYLIDFVKKSWTAVDSQTNAASNPIRAAEANRHQIIARVDASYSTSSIDGELTVLFGATVVARKHIHGAGAIDFGLFGFQNPTVNGAVSASLASGGVGVVGDVTITGYSTGPNA
jgi:hypothetical protein